MTHVVTDAFSHRLLASALEGVLQSWCTEGWVCWGSVHLSNLHAPATEFLGGWPVVESISNGLVSINFSICGGKREKKNIFQRGIFPVILNKFYLFVLGIEIRITSLAQMQIQSRKRNADSNCNLITMSCHVIRRSGYRQREM